MTGRLVALAAAADDLGVAAATLRVQISKGKLRARKYGRDWFVHPDEIARYRAESLGRTGRPRVDR